VLVEFDSIETLEEQWHLVNEAKLPCTAVITSGNKSLHAWVRVDAKNLAEYEQRRKLLFDHLEDHVDSKNANPGRLSRLPNSMRFDSRQELLALNVGAKNWQDFEAEIQAEAIGEEFDIETMMNFDTSNDPNNLLGNRWLCRGGSCLFVGQSGIGKSSLALQMAVTWALGKPVFGVKPVKPLKSLLIQAENDLGDVSEMLQGTLGGLGIKTAQEATSALQGRLAVVAEAVQTGEEFANAVRHLVAKHKPDLVWLDPLLSFIGDDISKQDVCSYFLRNLLNPIAHETGVVWMMMHHTPKPSTDPKSKSGWNSTDHSYAGTGSSELTNWARAVCVLQATKDEGRFVLRMAKRNKRTGAIDLDDNRTSLVHLKHAEDSILWEQTAAPMVVVKEKAKKEPKEKKSKAEVTEIRKKAAAKDLKFLDVLISNVTRPMKKTEIVKLAIDGGHGTYYLVKKHWKKIEGRLLKNKDALFLNPEQKS
jgi:RecA-family ATPase